MGPVVGVRPPSRPAARTSSVRAGLLAVAAAALALPLAWGVGGAGGAGTDARTPAALTRTTPSTILPHLESRATATWCGTASEVDITPNAVAGYPVHWIYVIPSDGEDRFSNFASVMQTDWETMDGWWRAQDSSRGLRSDLAQFSCGLQLDLSSVRLSLSSGQLGAPEDPFELIWDALVARGFSSQRTKYVVYYDGPVGNDNICGVGGTLSGGLGMAMYLVRSCPGVTSAEVAAHELVHAMGAVPSEAPHECASPNDGHTCDNDRDLMYPYTDGTPLAGLTLDPGRDDYYGHSGSWPDLQDSQWLIQLDRQAPVSLSITGPGRVVADVPGLDCTQSCTTTWNAGTQLLLSPTPATGVKLVRWSGACGGSSQCALVTGQSGPVTALFAPVTYRVNVKVSGKGRIRSSIYGIGCPGRCSATVPSYSPFRLTATAGRGWRFKSWSGACRGTRTVCTLPMSGNASARAVFVRR